MPEESDGQDVVIISSGIDYAQIIVSQIICIYKIVYNDVVGMVKVVGV